MKDEYIYYGLITLIILLLGVQLVSADSGIKVVAESNGGSFDFEGDGAETHMDLSITGFDEANVHTTNAWRYGAKIVYRDIGSGNILLSASHDYPYDSMYYYRWDKMTFIGDGQYVPPGNGGRSVSLSNSSTVTGTIEYPVQDRKAQFLRDTRHSHSDVTVMVHNGHTLENAIVTMYFTNPKVKWTDEEGRADFKLSQGTYHMTVEVDGYDAMLVDDLEFKNENHYLLNVNMTNCECTMGVPVCGPKAEDLLLYYQKKDPASETISPQGYVDYFAGRLRTCRAREDPEADGTLERFATKWGIYPSELNVLLYSCNFTKVNGTWDIQYTVKNYQEYKCNYTVTLIVGNETTELGSGVLSATWSERAKETTNVEYIAKNENEEKKMYLAVISERA